MPIKTKWFLFVLMLIVVPPVNCFAWHSKVVLWIMGGHTHNERSVDAINALQETSTDYADVFMATRQIDMLNGCSSERAHEGGRYDGGDVEAWWITVLANYTAFNFNEAYKRIGEIIHLTQDQAVPAHAANIYHPWYMHADKFEVAADKH